MSVVWKYPLSFGWPTQTRWTVPMPKGASILHVDAQNDTPTLWVLCDPKAEQEPRRFFAVGTGVEFKLDEGVPRHLGSVLLDQGRFVVHIFESVDALQYLVERMVP